MKTCFIVIFSLISLLEMGKSQSANDPVPITSIEIIDQAGNVLNTETACKSYNWKIKVVTPAYIESASKICYLEVLYDGTNWQALTDLSASGSISYISVDQIYGTGQKKFRTKKVLTGYDVVYSESPTSLYLSAPVKFYADHPVTGIAPDCPGKAGEVQIVNAEYPSYGLNVTFTDAAPGGNEFSTTGHNIKDSRLIEGHTYHVVIEYVGHPEYCPYQTDITIPYAPEFKVGLSGYVYNTIDNDGKQVQILNPGGKGGVLFSVSGSCKSTFYVKSEDGTTVSCIDYTGELIGNKYFYEDYRSIDLPKGTHSIIATSTSECQSAPLEVTLAEPDPITFDLEASTVTCHASCVAGNRNDGTITLSNLKGGIGGYYYDGTPILDGKLTFTRSQGGLNVMVRDDHYNYGTQFITVPQNDPLAFTIDSQTGPTLSCLSDGEVTVSNPSGGVGPYTFSSSLNTGYQSDDIVSGFTGGSHPVYIKDANSCVAQQMVTIPAAPAALAISNPQIISPKCHDDLGQYKFTVNNVIGTLSVTGAGISGNQIDIVGNDVTIKDLPGGLYNITITDTYNGKTCSIQTPFTIPVINAINIIPTVTRVRDKGTNTGSIELQVTGGNLGLRTFYLYDDQDILLDSIVSTANPVKFENLYGAFENGGKPYYINVKDVNSCSYSKDHSGMLLVPMPEPETVLDLKYTITEPVDCYGSSNADVSVTATGGWTKGYTYSKNDIDYQSSNIFNDFSEGYHTFYVTDYYGGKDSVKVYFSQPSRLTASYDSTQDVFCNGTSAGWLRYKVSGGTYPYSFAQQQSLQLTFRGNDTLLTAQNLAAGPWSFTIKDKNGCITSSLTDVITEPEKLVIPFTSIKHTSCELDNGILKGKAAGGTLPYTFQWNGLNNGFKTSVNGLLDTDTSRITDLEAGDYSLIVTDKNKCSVTSNLLTINPYTNPIITNVKTTDVRCYGEKNGALLVTAQDGTAPLSKYSLAAKSSTYSDTISTNLFEQLLPDTYFMYVFDNNGCRSDLPYPAIVDQPDESLNIVVDTIMPVLNKGTASGRIRSVIYGGNTGLKEVKLINSNGVLTDSSLQKNQLPFFFNNIYTGKYQILVKDAKNCSYQTVLSVIEPDEALGFRIVEKKDALCKSQSGNLTVQGYGGWGDYKYKRAAYNAYYTKNTFENLYAGNYLISVQDRYGATFTDTVVIYEPKDSLRSWVSHLQLPTCRNNGELQIAINGGTAPYKLFNESTKNIISVPKAQTTSFPKMYAGNYIMHITDDNGCHFDLETAILDTQLLKITSLETIFPSEINTNDGAIKAIVRGGSIPYTYQWKERFGNVFSETSAQLSNINSGHYEVKVTENGGCSDTAYTYLPGIKDSLFTISRIGNETFYKANNGFCVLTSAFDSWKSFELINPAKEQLSINPTGKTSGFYCNGDTVFLSNLGGGDYFISGITTNDEKVYLEFRIEPYLPYVISSTMVVDVAKKGEPSGEIALTVKGGGGGNRYEWKQISGGGNFGILSSVDSPENTLLRNIAAGDYSVSITDRYNNSIFDTIKVNEPETPLVISIAEHKHESCKTYEDAYVVLQAQGGWGDYQFKDDKTPYFMNGNTFNDLDVRPHKFYLVDKRGIKDSISFDIVEPAYLTSSVAFVDSVNCKNATDGNISFSVKGGTAPYKFSRLGEPLFWIKDTIDRNIAKGSYKYIFTDSNNCIGQDTLNVYMPEPDSLLFDKINVTHTTCNTNNGVIKVALKGGTRPYHYQWQDFNNNYISSDSVITQLAQNGHYTLNVLDWHNCPQHFEQRISLSVNPVITDIDTTAVLCYGDSTGTAFITGIKPGVPYAPYHIIWSNGDTGRIADGFIKGFHFATIADTNKCATVKYFEVTQPDSVWVSITNRKDAHCFGYNDAFLQVTGHGGLGNYRYKWATGDTTNLIKDLFKGIYKVEVTDSNKCSARAAFEITEPDKLEVDLGEDINMCPGNSQTIDGKDFTTHRWYTKSNEISKERYVTVKEAQEYFLEVTNDIGCFAWDTINISIGNDALKSDFLLTSQASAGDTLSVFELSNRELDSLQWKYSTTAFSKVENNTGLNYILYLKSLQTGIYNIELNAFSGGCISKSTKQVEIIAQDGSPQDDGNLGYEEPLIESFVVAPNPTDGNFTALVKLREAANINLVLFTTLSGVMIDERTERGLDNYTLDYQFSNLNSGIYLLILKAGNERKQVKIVVQQ